MEKFLIMQSETRGRSKQKYHIAIDDSSVKSNALYIYPNVSASRVDPPGKMKMKWFTFSSKKEYYPVIIRSNEEISGCVTDSKRILTMTVKCLEMDSKADEMPEPFDLECPQCKGIYWFQALRFHIAGLFSLKFSCGNFSDTEPLHFEIKVSDENVIEKSEIISSSVETPAATVADSSVMQTGTEGKRSLRINQQADKSKGLPPSASSPGITLGTSDVKEEKAPSTALKSGAKVKAVATPVTVSKRKRSSDDEKVAVDNISAADQVTTAEKPMEVDEGASKSMRSTRKSAKETPKDDHDREEPPTLIVKAEEIEQVLTEVKRPRVFPATIISFRNVQACPRPDTIVTIKTRLDPPPLIPITSSLSPSSSSSSSSSSQQSYCLPVQGPRLKVSLPQSLVRALLTDQVTHDKLCEYAQHANTNNRSVPNSGRYFRLPATCRTPSVCDLMEELKSACDPVLQATVVYLQHLFEFALPKKLLYPTEVIVYEDRLTSLQISKKILATEFGPYHYLRLLMFVVTDLDASGEDNDKFTCEVEMQKLQQVVDTAVKLLDEKAHVLFY